MKAMILAAGLGTRLRPLTDDRPKALVTIAGQTLLEITLRRLRRFGVDEAIVNVHHHADRMIDYLAANDFFGIRIEVSREDELLDTGGGLKNAAKFFLEPGANSGQPFFLHNVDVISDIDLAAMLHAHRERNALATLAVHNRQTSRQLLFDGDLRLCGRRTLQPGGEDADGSRAVQDRLARPCANPRPLAFSGIHVLSPEIFGKMRESGVFSIIDAYLGLAAAGEDIFGFGADGRYWRDLGRPASLLAAEKDIASGAYSAS